MDIRKTAKTGAMVFGLLTGLVAVSIPLLGIFVWPSLGVLLLKLLPFLFFAAIFFTLVAMLATGQLLLKLAVLPLLYLVFMISYIVWQMGIHLFFLQALAGDLSLALSSLGPISSMTPLLVFLPLGLFLFSLPLIVVGLTRARSLTSTKKQDLSGYLDRRGQILMLKDDWVKINRLKSYRITLAVLKGEVEDYRVSKDVLLPAHSLHSFSLGQRVQLKVRPDKKEEVFIVNEYGIF